MLDSNNESMDLEKELKMSLAEDWRKTARRLSSLGVFSSSATGGAGEQYATEQKEMEKSRYPRCFIPTLITMMALCFTAGSLVIYTVNEDARESVKFLISEYRLRTSITNFFTTKISIFEKESNIPVHLNIYGESNDVVDEILTECYNLKAAPFSRKASTEIQKVDYLSATSLCGYRNHIRPHNKLRVFFFMQNPVTSILTNFNEKSKEDKSLKLKDYIKTKANNNLLTRSILCKKPYEKLTHEDFEQAKKLLTHHFHIEFMNSFSKGMNRTRQLFHWAEQSNEKMNQCASAHIKALQKRINFKAVNDLDMLIASDSYDINLYMYLLGKNVL